MEPLGKMNAYFPVINDHISKRDKKVGLSLLSTPCLSMFLFCDSCCVCARRALSWIKLLDYDAARSKLRKAIEKPSDDPTKLPKVRVSLFVRF